MDSVDFAEKIRGRDYQSRTETVPVPGLADMVPGGFVIRNLGLDELARAKHARGRLESLNAAVEAVVTALGRQGKADALRGLLELQNDTEAEAAFRLEVLCAGCVSPKIDHEAAALLAKYHAGTVWMLTERIIALTGQGSVPGKPAGSSAIPASEEPAR